MKVISKRAKKYPPERDDEVVSKVDCEKCGAVVGHPCIPQTINGFRTCRPHRARWGRFHAMGYF